MFAKIQRFFESLLGQSKPLDERRRHKRKERRTPLLLQPLDQDLTPSDKSVKGMSLDFSQSGVGFSCTCEKKLECAYISVTIIEDQYSAIGRIRHSRETDTKGTFLYGVEFLNDQEE